MCYPLVSLTDRMTPMSPEKAHSVGLCSAAGAISEEIDRYSFDYCNCLYERQRKRSYHGKYGDGMDYSRSPGNAIDPSCRDLYRLVMLVWMMVATGYKIRAAHFESRTVTTLRLACGMLDP